MKNVNRFPWEFATVLLVVLGAAPRASANCDVTACGQLSASPCPRNFEEISRESCSSWGGSGGMAYCCPQNSTEGLLATTYGAELNEFPHMALLSWFGQDSCGATIYNKRYIITAAHCVVEKGIVDKPSDFTIKVGRNIGKIKMPNNDYQLEQIIVHPKYSKLSGNPADGTYYDIALIRLARDIEFSDTVKSLEIAPERFNEIANGNNVVIVGWGTTHTFKGSDHLQKTNLAIRTDETCFGDGRMGRKNGVWSRYGRDNLPPQLLCVGGHLEDIYHPVAGKGDSGGPAICRGPDGYAVLCGVTSFGGNGENCFRYGGAHCPPSVYAEVDYFRKWIKDHAKEQDPRTFHRVKLYGEPAPASRAAHQVHITSDGGKPCGGTLIAPDTVVTAAQCVAPGDGQAKAYPGIQIESGGKSVRVKSINILPGFQRMAKKLPGKRVDKRMISSYKPHVLEHMVLSTDRYFKNDLAVLKLTEKLNANAGKLPRLPNLNDKPSQPAYELSFPRNSSRGSQLMQREFNILEKDECVRRINRMDRVGLKVKVDENILCGVEKYSGGSTCDRELGGGLICTGKTGKESLCGVQILRLCQWSVPNAFLDVRKHLDWINKAQNSQLQNSIIPEYPEKGSQVAHREPQRYDDIWRPQMRFPMFDRGSGNTDTFNWKYSGKM